MPMKTTTREKAIVALESVMARLNVDDDDPDIKDLSAIIEDYRPGMIPSVLSGWLLLQRSNLSAQERATVLASAKDSLELADVEQALRDQWADSELRERDAHAGRGKGASKGRAYTAEEEEGEGDDADHAEDADEADYVSDDEVDL